MLFMEFRKEGAAQKPPGECPGVAQRSSHNVDKKRK
jgi:hypothetical protein